MDELLGYLIAGIIFICILCIIPALEEARETGQSLMDVLFNED